MNHVRVSPTDGNGPTQGQPETLTRVGIRSPLLNRLTYNKHVQLEAFTFGNFASSVNVAQAVAPVVEVMITRSLSKRYFVSHMRSEYRDVNGMRFLRIECFHIWAHTPPTHSLIGGTVSSEVSAQLEHGKRLHLHIRRQKTGMLPKLKSFLTFVPIFHNSKRKKKAKIALVKSTT